MDKPRTLPRMATTMNLNYTWSFGRSGTHAHFGTCIIECFEWVNRDTRETIRGQSQSPDAQLVGEFVLENMLTPLAPAFHVLFCNYSPIRSLFETFIHLARMANVRTEMGKRNALCFAQNVARIPITRS